MRPLILKTLIVVALLITACAPRAAATPDAAVPTVDEGGLTVIPAEFTPLPTSSEPLPTVPAPSHDDFVAADLTIEPWSGVQQRFADAFTAGEAWTDDPDQIAMQFALNPTAMAFAETIQRSDTHAIMLVTELIAEDDSLAEQQILLELSRPTATDAWVVDYIGLRWKCREGRGQQDWAPELCV